MTIIYCGQLVTSTVNNQDLRDWVVKNKFLRANFVGRKVYICPKNALHRLDECGAVELPRFLFNAAAWWSDYGRSLELQEDNSANLPGAVVRVRDITQDGQVVAMVPNVEGMVFLQPEDLLKPRTLV
jgi:hypothetical protein